MLANSFYIDHYVGIAYRFTRNTGEVGLDTGKIDSS